MNPFILKFGGHGKVVAEITTNSYKFENIYFLDDNKKIGSKVLKFKIINCIDYQFIQTLKNKENYFIVLWKLYSKKRYSK